MDEVKSYSSMHDANAALPDLGMKEVVVICGVFYRVVQTLLGKCFKRIRDTEFYEEIQSPDGRSWGNGKRGNSGMRTSNE